MTKTKRRPRRWRRVQMSELIRIWHSLKGKPIWNGITYGILLRRYGEGRLKCGTSGKGGWYKLVATSLPNAR